MEKLVFVGLCLFAAFAISEATVCKSNTDCDADSCCYIEPEFLVMSKKRQGGILPVNIGHVHHDTGVCEQYRVMDEHCAPLETANGHCGCGSGMSCQWVPDPTKTAPLVAQVGGRRRSMVYHPEPGAYKCAMRYTGHQGQHFKGVVAIKRFAESQRDAAHSKYKLF